MLDVPAGLVRFVSGLLAAHRREIGLLRGESRSLALPTMPVAALTGHQERQARARPRAGELWQEQGLVFTTALGTKLDAGNVRRSLRAICRLAGIGENWTPRELRHTFVSLQFRQRDGHRGH